MLIALEFERLDEGGDNLQKIQNNLLTNEAQKQNTDKNKTKYICGYVAFFLQSTVL